MIAACLWDSLNIAYGAMDEVHRDVQYLEVFWGFITLVRVSAFEVTVMGLGARVSYDLLGTLGGK